MREPTQPAPENRRSSPKDTHAEQPHSEPNVALTAEDRNHERAHNARSRARRRAEGGSYERGGGGWWSRYLTVASLYGVHPCSAHDAISSSLVRAAAIPLAPPIVGEVTTGAPQIGQVSFAQ